MGKRNSISQPQFGQQLNAIRVEKGLTQLELREISHVSVRTIQRIESGAVTPRTATIKILLEALGENLDEWFGETRDDLDKFSIKTLKNMFLVNPSDLELRNALTPAWIAGIIYLLMVLIELGLEDFSDHLNEEYLLHTSLITVKIMAAMSFFLFARGLLSLAHLFEIQFLKMASYASMASVAAVYLIEAAVLIPGQEYSFLVADTVRTLSIVPLGCISILLGIGLLRLQDGMGKIAKIAGRLEIIFGTSYVSLVLAFIGMLLLIPLLVVEIVLLAKADQLVRGGEL